MSVLAKVLAVITMVGGALGAIVCTTVTAWLIRSGTLVGVTHNDSNVSGILGFLVLQLAFTLCGIALAIIVLAAPRAAVREARP